MRPVFKIFIIIATFLTAMLNAQDVATFEAHIIKLQKEMNNKQEQFNTQFEAHRGEEKKLNTLKQELDYSNQEIERSKKDLEKAEMIFSKAQEFQKFRPEISIDKEKNALVEARKQLEESKASKRAVEEQITDQKRKVSVAYHELQSIETDYNLLADQLVQTQIDLMVTQLESEKSVTAGAQFSCGELSIANCKKAALEAARRKAMELGSSVLIESVTLIEDFELKRDEIRSSARAIIKDVEILDNGWIGETGYYYKIKAVVIGQPPEGIKHLFKPKRLQWGISPVRPLYQPKKPEPQPVAEPIKIEEKKPEPKEEIKPQPVTKKQEEKKIEQKPVTKKKTAFFVSYSPFFQLHSLSGNDTDPNVSDKGNVKGHDIGFGFGFDVPVRTHFHFATSHDDVYNVDLTYNTMELDYSWKPVRIGMGWGMATMDKEDQTFEGQYIFWKAGIFHRFVDFEVEGGFEAGQIRWERVGSENISSLNSGRGMWGGYVGINYYFQ